MAALVAGGTLGSSVLASGARAEGQTVSGTGGWTAVAAPSSAPLVTKFFPLAEVKRGMRGVAYTVFEGVNPEPMQVEILARLHCGKPEYTGVVAGMSGSPVYIDGRLVGALSYRIGQFSKEPIAGITPIESMLQVRDEDGAAGMRLASVSKEFEGQPEMRAIETPLVMGGFNQETVERFGDRFRAMGLT